MLPHPDEATKCIREKGVCWMPYEGNEGAPLRDLYRLNFPLKTPKGLQFCADRTLLNQKIRTIVESLIDRPCLGFVKVYGDKLPTEFAHFFHAGRETTLVVIQLWAPGSRVIWHEGCYSDHFKDKKVDDWAEKDKEWGLLRVPRKDMKKSNFEENEQELVSGALAITDGRLGFTILHGWTLCLGFATETPWAKMEVKDSEEMRSKVAELRESGFAMNIVFDSQ